MAGLSRELKELLQTLKFLDRNIEKYREEGAPPAFVEIVVQRRSETIAEIQRLHAEREPLPQQAKQKGAS